MDILGQSALLVALVSMSYGISLLTRNIKNKLFISFGGLCLLIGVWALSFFWEQVEGGGFFYRMHLFFNIWLAPTALSFVGVMMRTRDKLSERLFWFSAILSLILSALLLMRLDQVRGVMQIIYFSPALVVVQILQLIRIDKSLSHGRKRQFKKPTVGVSPDRRILIYLGGLFVLLFSVMDHAPFLGPWIPVIGNLGLIAYLGFLNQAVNQQRLMNLGALLARILVLFWVSVAITGIYTLLFGWMQNDPIQFFLNSLIMAFVLLIFIEPIQRSIRILTQKLATKEHRKIQEIVKGALSRIVSLMDVDELLDDVNQTMRETIAPRRLSLYTLDEDGAKFVAVRSYGELIEGSGEITKEILSDHLLLRYCLKKRSSGQVPILLDQLLEHELERSAGQSRKDELLALIQGLRVLQANLMIPFIDDRGKVFGFAMVYAPMPPEPWGNNWGMLTLLYPYFEQVAKTFRTMEVYVKQRDKERLAALGEMAAGLAHEIRNPLGAIKGAAQMLESPNELQGRYLQVITEEVDRLNHVVNQFLDYSKPSPQEFETADLSEVVERTIASVKTALMTSKNASAISIEYLPSSYPTPVHVDRVRIQQLVMNLVQNSVKALQPVENGTITVSVNVTSGSFGASQKEAQIVVEDNGTGISRDVMKKLFIPFFTTSSQGTGLGLSISHKIVKDHFGKIKVSSVEGKFTRFVVSLPLVEKAATVMEPEAKPDLRLEMTNEPVWNPKAPETHEVRPDPHC